MPINAVSWPRKSLRATLCEIELGLFYVTYPDINVAVDGIDLATYQVSASADEAKRQVEQNARTLGYETVVWNDANSAPLFSPESMQSVTKPSTAVDAVRQRL